MLLLLVWWPLLVFACAPPAGAPATPETKPGTAPVPDATSQPLQYVLIGKARDDYWAGVERGALDAAQQLGLPDGSIVTYAPDQEDPAAQILAVEHFVAQKVQGIALAPSDPLALELAIREARDAGIWLITFDTDAPDSQRLIFVGTPESTVGREAGAALLKLLGQRSGKAALGSTLLDAGARDRIAAFKDALGAGRASSKLVVLDPVDDKRDPSLAAQFVKTTISSNKDLVGAFGVYTYNSTAWCHAVRAAQAMDRIAVVGFDVNAETVGCLKDSALDALVVPRSYAQGTQSVLVLDSLERKGLIDTAGSLHLDTRAAPAAWVVDVGVDVISLRGAVGISLSTYAAKLDAEHIVHDWQP